MVITLISSFPAKVSEKMIILCLIPKLNKTTQLLPFFGKANRLPGKQISAGHKGSSVVM